MISLPFSCVRPPLRLVSCRFAVRVASGAVSRRRTYFPRRLRTSTRSFASPSSDWDDVEVLEEEEESDWQPLELATDEELQEELDLFEYDSGPVSSLQELVALGIGALLFAASLNIAWRLAVVCISIAASAFKYSFLTVVLVFFLIYIIN